MCFDDYMYILHNLNLTYFTQPHTFVYQMTFGIDYTQSVMTKWQKGFIYNYHTYNPEHFDRNRNGLGIASRWPVHTRVIDFEVEHLTIDEVI